MSLDAIDASPQSSSGTASPGQIWHGRMPERRTGYRFTGDTRSIEDQAPGRAGRRTGLATVARDKLFRRAVIAGDVLASVLAVWVAIAVASPYGLRWGFVLVVPLTVLLAKVQGLYDRDELVIRKSTLDEFPRLLNLATLVAMLAWLSRHYFVIGAPSTWPLLRLWATLVLFIVMGRAVARELASWATPPERCFFFGDLETARQVETKLRPQQECRAGGCRRRQPAQAGRAGDP